MAIRVSDLLPQNGAWYSVIRAFGGLVSRRANAPDKQAREGGARPVGTLALAGADGASAPICRRGRRDDHPASWRFVIARTPEDWPAAGGPDPARVHRGAFASLRPRFAGLTALTPAQRRAVAVPGGAPAAWSQRAADTWLGRWLTQRRAIAMIKVTAIELVGRACPIARSARKTTRPYGQRTDTVTVEEHHTCQRSSVLLFLG